jgi:hypothetical protein
LSQGCHSKPGEAAEEQIEAEAAQKQKARLALVGRGDAPVASPKVLTWEKLEILGGSQLELLALLLYSK